MGRIDWNKRKEEALKTLSLNAKSYPLVKRGKPLVFCRSGGSSKAIEKLMLPEEGQEMVVYEDIPYVRALSEYACDNPGVWDKDYLILVSEDKPSALKCAVLSAGARTLNEEGDSDAFYYAE